MQQALVSVTRPGVLFKLPSVALSYCKNVHINVSITIIHDSKQVEKAQVSIKKRMHKQNAIQPHKRRVGNNRKAWKFNVYVQGSTLETFCSVS